MRRCTQCILPETWAGIEFDENGVCNYCRDEKKRDDINWQAKEEDFKTILDECKKRAAHNNVPYDCVVPFSGGKDSTYTLYTMITKYNMKPLAATADHCFFTDVMKENHKKIFKQLGAGHIIYKPNWQVVRKICAKAFKLTGDFCWHCHLGTYSFPMRVAAMFKIPCVIWGTSDYNLIHEDNQPRDRTFWNKVIIAKMEGLKPEDLAGDGVTPTDIKAFTTYPSDEELKGIISINQGAYHRWNALKQAEIIKKELGWKGRKVEGSYVDWDNVECKYIGVRDYIKFLRRGLGRSCQLASADIRHGVMTRNEALKIMEEHDGKKPDSLTEFLDDINMTEEEFMEIAQRHKVY